MHYHAHITISYKDFDTPPPSGWKKTTIVLDKEGREQTDFMLTKHYMIGRNNLTVLHAIIADVQYMASAQHAVRYKIEQDSDFNRPITEKEYLECHIKVRDGEVCELEGFQRSKNPNEIIDGKPVYFWNKRWYSGFHNQIKREVVQQLNLIEQELLEVKFEHVLIDSRHELDSWWA